MSIPEEMWVREPSTGLRKGRRAGFLLTLCVGLAEVQFASNLVSPSFSPRKGMRLGHNSDFFFLKELAILFYSVSGYCISVTCLISPLALGIQRPIWAKVLELKVGGGRGEHSRRKGMNCNNSPATIKSDRCRELAQWLRALALAEDPDWAPSSNMAVPNHPVPEDPVPSSDLPGTRKLAV